MKALSLRQPWAELILLGRKTIETRKWNTKFRGRFLIHASGNIERDKCVEFNLDPSNLPRGAIVGEAELVSVKKYVSKQDFDKDLDKHWAEGFYSKHVYGFILKNIKRIKPKPYKGKLGFFEVEEL